MPTGEATITSRRPPTLERSTDQTYPMSNDKTYPIRYIEAGECYGECYLCGAVEGLAEGNCWTLTNGKAIYECNQCSCTSYAVLPEWVKKSQQQLKDENPDAKIAGTF